MITHLPYQNILNITEGIILHGCNTLGAMGAGVALGIKMKHRLAYLEYRKEALLESKKELLLGKVVFTKINEFLFIASAFTQLRFGTHDADVFEYEKFKQALIRVVEKAKQENLPIYSVKIGAGLAGGDWTKILSIFEEVIPEDQPCFICHLKQIDND